MLSTALFAGCNSDNNNGTTTGNQTPNTPPAAQTSNFYTTTFTPVNPNQTSTGQQAGTALVSVVGDTITVNILATGTDANITHFAYIKQGSSCPPSSDPSDNDGVIDAVEAQAFTGPILVLLGGDISSLSASQNNGGLPFADGSGNINYTGTGSFSSLNNDLVTRAAPAADSGYANLQPGQTIDLSTAVIEVDSIADTSSLPATVQTLAGLTPQQSLPILCGTLQFAGNVAPSPSPSPAADAGQQNQDGQDSSQQGQ